MSMFSDLSGVLIILATTVCTGAICQKMKQVQHTALQTAVCCCCCERLMGMVPVCSIVAKLPFLDCRRLILKDC